MDPVFFEHSRSYPLYAVSPERWEIFPFTDSSSTLQVTIIAPGRGPSPSSVSVLAVCHDLGFFNRPLFLFNGTRITIIRRSDIVHLPWQTSFANLICAIALFRVFRGFFVENFLPFASWFVVATLYACNDQNNCGCFRFNVKRGGNSGIPSIRSGSFNLSRFLLLFRRDLACGARNNSETCVEKGFRTTSNVLCVYVIRRDRKTLYLQVWPR